MGCDYYPFYADYVTEEHVEDNIHVDINHFKKFINKHVK